MHYDTKILHTDFVTHDVSRFILERPDGFDWTPGQGVELAIDRADWLDQGRPFTPTGDPDAPVLEFMIKRYPSRDGVTDRLNDLGHGTPLRMSQAFGTITDHGPGTFIAGGAGVTPFLAILRERQRADSLAGCTLLFTNDTPADVIAEKELRHMLGDELHLTCTEDAAPGCDQGRIDRDYLAEHVPDLDRFLYVCGPPEFVEDVSAALVELGADRERLVVEG